MSRVSSRPCPPRAPSPHLAHSRNGLTDACCAALARALPFAASLEVLDLSANSLGAVGLETLAFGFALCPALTALALDRNLWRETMSSWVPRFKHHLLRMLDLTRPSSPNGKVVRTLSKLSGGSFRSAERSGSVLAASRDAYSLAADRSHVVDFSPLTWLNLGQWPPSEPGALYGLALFLARADDAQACAFLGAAVTRLAEPFDTCVMVITALFAHDPPRAIRFGVSLALQLQAQASAERSARPIEYAALRELFAVTQLSVTACIDLMDEDARDAAADFESPPALAPVELDAVAALPSAGGAGGGMSRSSSGAIAAGAGAALAPTGVRTGAPAGADAYDGADEIEHLAAKLDTIMMQSDGAPEVRRLFEREDVWAALEQGAEGDARCSSRPTSSSSRTRAPSTARSVRSSGNGCGSSRTPSRLHGARASGRSRRRCSSPRWARRRSSFCSRTASSSPSPSSSPSCSPTRSWSCSGACPAGRCTRSSAAPPGAGAPLSCTRGPSTR